MHRDQRVQEQLGRARLGPEAPRQLGGVAAARVEGVEDAEDHGRVENAGFGVTAAQARELAKFHPLRSYQDMVKRARQDAPDDDAAIESGRSPALAALEAL